MKVNPACGKLVKSFRFFTEFAMILSWFLLPALAAGQASVVQVNSSNSAFIYRSIVFTPFINAQAAGNLNVVVVGWNDTSATIATVGDSNGNTYSLAATTVSTPVPAPGPGAGSQVGVSQAIYYAKNINAGANIVTVTFNQNTAVQSVRTAEYTGLDLVNPLDTSVGQTGTANPADSGAVTTNSANDLLFGAGTITTGFTGSGTGYTTQLLNGLNDIIEDRSVAAAGSYDATAATAPGGWVMQMVAFRVAGQTLPVFAAPAVTSLSIPSSPEAGGVAITISGTNFEPGAAVVFSNTGGTTAVGVNCSVTLLTAPNATISCLTPSFPAGSATVTVTNVDGQISPISAFTFTASTPFATAAAPSITPNEGSTNGGTVVAISGSDFAAGAKVTVGGVPADRVSVTNINTIQASMPASTPGLPTVVVTNPSSTAGTLPVNYGYLFGTGINFVQVNSMQPASPATTVNINYPVAQAAGDLNVVVIGWADATTTVSSVTDSSGNTYTLAFNPTVGTGLSQAIYYAKNINAAAASSNTVTVTFNAAALAPDVRVLEYNGVNPTTPLDAGGGAFGTSTALDSGPITTTIAGDLVIGGSMTSGAVSATGLAFTTVTTTTPGGIGVEHLVGPAAGAIDAVATQDTSANWVMQAVAFQQNGPVLDFSISATPTTASVGAGTPATYTISVSAINGFSSPVKLTCSAGLPLGTQCAFNPDTVTPGATAATSTLTISTTAITPVATSSVTVTGTSVSLSHDATVGLTVTMAVPDFILTAGALSPASVAAGASATSTVTVTPVIGFTGDVTLACSVSPSATRGPTCSFSSATVAGGSGTSTLTVSTSAATSASLSRQSKGALYAMWLPVAGLALLGAGFRSRKKKLWGFVLGCVLFSGLNFLAACGGSSSSGGGGGGGTGQPATPSGSYTVTVTGTSGSLTHTTTVTLTVQ